jgi:quinol monooxygenase YgiN
MIRHLVMWKLHDPANAPAFKAKLDSCANLVPGMHAFEVAIRTNGLEANMDVVLNAVFADQTALDAYQNHPHHKSISAQLGPLRQLRCVLDYVG